MPLGDQSRTLLTSALRDPLVVTRYGRRWFRCRGQNGRTTRHLSRHRRPVGALVKRDWAGYIAEREGQPSGPEQK